MYKPFSLIRRCLHCGNSFEYFPNIEPKEACNYCSPDCLNCEQTKRDDFWAAPCKIHKEKAEKRNDKYLRSNICKQI